MIRRYENKDISNIWSNDSRFKYFLKVEIALLEEIFKEKKLPKTDLKEIYKAKIDVDRIKTIEKEVHHDVIAFCTSITEQFPKNKNIQKFFHYGVTSSDIIDSAIGIQIKESIEYTLNYLQNFMNVLYERSIEHKSTLCIGRSHGIFAEPISFGQKLLGHWYEFNRRKKDLQKFLNEECTGMLSGAVGNYTLLDKKIEENVLKKIGLVREDISTQIIPRDRYAKLAQIYSLIASACERLAVEIRHLHRSEVNEVSEGFSKGQKGSSTMPHKKNPISTENISGLSRMIKSYSNIALENNVLWHERDISHSSSERMYLPDMFGLTCYVLNRFNSTIKNLVVHNDRMEERLISNNIYFSSYILHILLDHTNLSRDEIYPIVQSLNYNQDFVSDILNNNLIQKNSEIELLQTKLNDLSKKDIKVLYNLYGKEVKEHFNVVENNYES